MLRKKKLDNVNFIIYDNTDLVSAEFAKLYYNYIKYDYQPVGNLSKEDEEKSDQAYTQFGKKFKEIKEKTKRGFAGSKKQTFQHIPTQKYILLDVTPNGKTFYGNDHDVRNLGKELIEVTDTLTGFAAKTPENQALETAWRRGSISSREKLKKKYNIHQGYSKLRGGALKLGVTNDLHMNSKLEIPILDGKKLAFVSKDDGVIKVRFVAEHMNSFKNLILLEKKPSEPDVGGKIDKSLVFKKPSPPKKKSEPEPEPDSEPESKPELKSKPKKLPKPEKQKGPPLITWKDVNMMLQAIGAPGRDLKRISHLFGTLVGKSKNDQRSFFAKMVDPFGEDSYFRTTDNKKIKKGKQLAWVVGYTGQNVRYPIVSAIRLGTYNNTLGQLAANNETDAIKLAITDINDMITREPIVLKQAHGVDIKPIDSKNYNKNDFTVAPLFQKIKDVDSKSEDDKRDRDDEIDGWLVEYFGEDNLDNLIISYFIEKSSMPIAGAPYKNTKRNFHAHNEDDVKHIILKHLFEKLNIEIDRNSISERMSGTSPSTTKLSYYETSISKQKYENLLRKFKNWKQSMQTQESLLEEHKINYDQIEKSFKIFNNSIKQKKDLDKTIDVLVNSLKTELNIEKSDNSLIRNHLINSLNSLKLLPTAQNDIQILVDEILLLGEEYGAGFEGTPELLKKYQKDTPGQFVSEVTSLNRKIDALMLLFNETKNNSLISFANLITEDDILMQNSTDLLKQYKQYKTL